ncbi:MAG: esterase-like activity of phytase family protein, partial [Actinomycetia bacterium]|nr:esterase-like activity of phytase family protein [Actinomycetes bacterium]
KTAQGDPEGQLRLYRFDPRAGEFMEDAPFRRYQLSEEQGHYIGAICALNEQELAIVERDDFQGEEAAFKKVFVVKLDDHENGVLRKRELVDLLLIPDPVLLAREVEGNRVTGSFAMPFVTIEGIACLDEHTLLVCNDNNYPFSVGRNLRQQLPDDNEIVLIHLR